MVTEASSWWGTLRPWLLQLVLPLVAAAALLGGLLYLAGWARHWLRGSGAARVRFADIQCAAPPGLSRGEFLAEVQFLGGLPDELDPLDEGATERVRAAFREHRWVRAAGLVQLRRGVARVEVAFRQPVLYVDAWNRAVDREAAILPNGADLTGLFVLKLPLPAPQGQMAKAASVRAAASLSGFLLAHRGRLSLDGAELIVNDNSWQIVRPACRVRWGRPPGEEADGEPGAKEKARRLLAAVPLDGHDWDARRPDALTKTPIDH